ncbi:nucleotidyltransferase domain-containing protein [Streptomyces sp. NPDC001373]|uniref:nucleotidyltransferase domain-containing protein n=1 Tax=Streptomyces sp. NPDC001373 TaxID=3364565 RepID=UPI0036AEE549
MTAGISTRWDPAPLREVAALFGRAGCRWWIAGGHAIELAAGRALRPHDDIDVLLLRDDQHAVQEVLAGWEWWAADPPATLRPWRPGEHLHSGVHDIWCRPAPGTAWRIQVMLDEAGRGQWVSRRDDGVRRPVAGIGAVSPDGIPYLRPEIQLYYKAKRPRPKDKQDFDAALPLLGTERRAWLADAITHTFGSHPWAVRLR